MLSIIAQATCAWAGLATVAALGFSHALGVLSARPTPAPVSAEKTHAGALQHASGCQLICAVNR